MDFIIDHLDLLKIGGGVFIALIAAIVCKKAIDRLERRLSSTYSSTNMRGGIRVLKITLLTLCGLGALQWLGIPLSGMIAFGGVGGIAAGFAAKDLLSNLFGGMMIFMDHQFEIGDWIRSPDRNIEGTVENIGWRLTKVRTADQRPLYIPNAVFSNISIENPSRMRRRQMKVNLPISYEDHSKVGEALREIEDLLKNHPEIDNTSVYFANLINFGRHALDIQIAAFTKTTDMLKFQRIQQEILLHILKIVENHSVTIGRPLLNVE